MKKCLGFGILRRDSLKSKKGEKGTKYRQKKRAGGVGGLTFIWASHSGQSHSVFGTVTAQEMRHRDCPEESDQLSLIA